VIEEGIGVVVLGFALFDLEVVVTAAVVFFHYANFLKKKLRKKLRIPNFGLFYQSK
jgi:hypothetical protein